MTALALGLLLLVRTYDWVGVSAPDLDTARRVAGDIQRDAGVGVAWLICPVAADAWSPIPPCAEAQRANELLVRVTSGHRVVGVDDRVLGNAYLDARAGTGPLATLYVDRIEAMAARSGVGVGTVLGRAMAHELGHLLLGHSRHRDRGLMRAYWSEAGLQSRIPGDWLFSREDARRMARNLALRTEGLDADPTRPAQD